MNALAVLRKLAQAVGTLARRKAQREATGALEKFLSRWEAAGETSTLTQQLVDAGLAGLAVVARHGPHDELRVLEVASAPWLRAPEPGAVLLNRLTVAGSILMADLQKGQPFVLNDSPNTINVTFEWSREATLRNVMIVPLWVDRFRPGALALFGEMGLSLEELQKLAAAVSHRMNARPVPSEKTVSAQAPAKAAELKREIQPAFDALRGFVLNPPRGGVLKSVAERYVWTDGALLAVDHLRDLVHDLLKKYAAPDFDPSSGPEKVNLRDVIGEVMCMVRPSATARGVALALGNCAGCEIEVPVVAYRHLFLALLQALLDETSDGRTLQIEVSQTRWQSILEIRNEPERRSAPRSSCDSDFGVPDSPWAPALQLAETLGASVIRNGGSLRVLIPRGKAAGTGKGIETEAVG